MHLEDDVRKLSLDLLQPLCQESQKFFRKVRISDTDRLFVSSTKDNKHFKLRFKSFWQGRETAGSYDARWRFPNRLPEWRRLPNGDIQVGATDLSSIIISHHWPIEQIIFEDKLSESQFRYSLSLFYSQILKLRKRDEDFLPIRDSAIFPLAKHQRVGYRGGKDSEGYGLFMEQGTGKTAVAIARICNEAHEKALRKEGIYRALVVCPLAVRENWVAEFHRFATERGRITVVRGDKINRVKCLIDALRNGQDSADDRFTVVVCSYDSVAVSLEMFMQPEWDLCVLDESHYIKTPSTRRWKSFVQLRERCRQRMCMTGTPILKNVLDLWTQLEFMGEGWSGFSSFKAFKTFYGKFADNSDNPQAQHNYERIVGMQNLPLLQERLARVAYFVSKKEALPDLPKKMYDMHEVEMTQDQTRVYDELQTQLVAEIEADLNAATRETQMLVVQNGLTKMLRLAQITSGHVGISEQVDEDGTVITPKKVIPFSPNPKTSAVVQMLKEKKPEQKTIVWVAWTENLMDLKRALDAEGIACRTYYGSTSERDRKEAEWAFNHDPEMRVLIGNAAAGGTGLNLLGYDYTRQYDGLPPTYCDHVIYYSQNWNPRDQSEDRAHRKGTATHVRYTDLIVPGTIDVDIRMRVVEKRQAALEVQDIRSILERIKGR